MEHAHKLFKAHQTVGKQLMIECWNTDPTKHLSAADALHKIKSWSNSQFKLADEYKSQHPQYRPNNWHFRTIYTSKYQPIIDKTQRTNSLVSNNFWNKMVLFFFLFPANLVV